MKQEVINELLNLLATQPEGLSAPELRARLSDRFSQPTVWRYLDRLRARGLVTVEGKARATRYHASGRVARADLRSRRMHESIARKIVREPALRGRVRGRLEQLRAVNPHGRPYHDKWTALIDGPVERLLRTMTEDSDAADTLRRESPFTVLIDRRERARIFDNLATT